MHISPVVHAPNCLPRFDFKPDTNDVLVELKVAAFSHENIEQLNTYVTWYRRHMMTDGDNPPVGILLCTQKNQALVDCDLAGIDNALFVSKYQLELPSKAQMQRFLEEQLASRSM